jgi:hypothetical protein
MTNSDLESELRNALRRKQPARDLMPDVPPRPARNWRLYAIAATLAICLIGGEVHRIREQQRAKDQLVFALRFTAVKLQHTRTQLQTIRSERLQ